MKNQKQNEELEELDRINQCWFSIHIIEQYEDSVGELTDYEYERMLEICNNKISRIRDCVEVGMLGYYLERLDQEEFAKEIYNEYEKIHNKKEDSMISTKLLDDYKSAQEKVNEIMNAYQNKYGRFKSVVDNVTVCRCLGSEINKMVSKANKENRSFSEVFAETTIDELVERMHESSCVKRSGTDPFNDFINAVGDFFDTIGKDDADENESPLDECGDDKCSEDCGEQETDNTIKNENNMNETLGTGKCFAEKRVVNENDDAKIIKILMPGVSKKNINIEVVDDEIQISLKDIEDEIPFVNPNMKSSFTVTEDMDIDNMCAKLELGILTVKIPKIKREVKRRTITIL